MASSDIQNRDDIKLLVNSFYKKAMYDELIGHFFTQVIELDLQKHMPVIYNFWDSVPFGAKAYEGNPMTKHINLHKKSPMKQEHFDKWIVLWKETIDELFLGDKANEAKNRAEQIAKLMHFQVQNQ